MDPVRDLESVLDEARALIDTIPSGDLKTPTPCAGWDVRALIDHMTGVCQMFASALQGTDGPSGGAQAGAPGPHAGTDEVAAAYARAANTLLEEYRAPGAMEKTLKLPFGEAPASRAIGVVLADQLIHSWDLAQAIGRPIAMDERLAADSLQLMQQLMAQNQGARGPGKAFADEVPCPEGASIQDRLIAFSGRQP